jgi:hypothetical protein
MTDSWNINVGGRSYGPYSLQQMQGLVAEGRLAPHSQVSQPGSDAFFAAKDDVRLAALFSSSKKREPVPSATGRFFTAKGAVDDEANSPKFGRSSDEATGTERGRYLIIADMKSRSIAGLEEEILNLGPAYALLPQIWLLVSDLSMNAIRNALVQKLGKIDMLFVIDATRNKATWFNFGPEADARIRRVWSDQQLEDLETIVGKR